MCAKKSTKTSSVQFQSSSEVDSYVALCDNVMGIKKDDIVIEKDGKFFLEKNSQQLPFDVRVEKKFFEFRPKIVSKFKAGDKIFFSISIEAPVLEGRNNLQSNQLFKIPPFLEGTVREIKINNQQINPIRRRKNNTTANNFSYHVVVGKWMYQVSSMHESHMDICSYYWFISSKGNVQKEIINKEIGVDEFRKKTGNYFNSKEEANSKLKELLK